MLGDDLNDQERWGDERLVVHVRPRHYYHVGLRAVAVQQLEADRRVEEFVARRDVGVEQLLQPEPGPLVRVVGAGVMKIWPSSSS